MKPAEEMDKTLVETYLRRIKRKVDRGDRMSWSDFQDYIGNMLGHEPRTVRRWLAGERTVQGTTPMVIRMLARGHLTPEKLARARR